MLSVIVFGAVLGNGDRALFHLWPRHRCTVVRGQLLRNVVWSREPLLRFPKRARCSR